MIQRTHVLGAGALLAALVALPLTLAQEPAIDAAGGPKLERIKALAGTWVKVDESGRPTDEVASIFRVTAAGSAVIETLFPGQEMEMVTVYHQDGDQLVLTHYCAAGNQPHMHASAESNAERLIFECVSVSNLAGADARHMHHAIFTLLGPDRLKTEWDMVEGGETIYTASFDLARVNAADR